MGLFKRAVSLMASAVCMSGCIVTDLPQGFTVLPITAKAEDRYTSGDYFYTVADGEAAICGYNGSDTVIIIPEEIDGYTVTSIERNAFRDNYDIRCNLAGKRLNDILRSILRM